MRISASSVLNALLPHPDYRYYRTVGKLMDLCFEYVERFQGRCGILDSELFGWETVIRSGQFSQGNESCQ